jgi:hypothetical protein
MMHYAMPTPTQAQKAEVSLIAGVVYAMVNTGAGKRGEYLLKGRQKVETRVDKVFQEKFLSHQGGPDKGGRAMPFRPIGWQGPWF